MSVYVNKSEFLHLNAVCSMFEQMISENVVQNEKLLFKLISSLHPLIPYNILVPHLHEFPSLKFLEEVQLLDMVE